MTKTFDVAIVGLGAMGSAAAYHLARRGRSVLGLDRYTPPHTLGSSHGGTRIIRQAYYDDPLYVPMILRAYDLWADLESATGMSLYRKTGGLMLGPEDGEVVTGARTTAEQHGLEHAVYGAAELHRRFPGYQPPAGTAGVWDPPAGILTPERCIEAHLDQAARAGATLRFNEPLDKWMPDGDGFVLRTASGEYRAERMVLAAGAWMPQLLSRLNLPLQVTRQLVFWFDPADHAADFTPERCPVYVWELPAGEVIYGFPDLGAGFKIGRHDAQEVADPDSINRDVSDDEVDGIRAILAQTFPNASGDLRAAEVCMYTNTADRHFVLDIHPKRPGIVIVSPCSGHGFKFAAVIGEIVADLVIDGRSAFDLSLFNVNRLLEPRLS